MVLINCLQNQSFAQVSKICSPELVSEKNVLKESSACPMEASLGIIPSGWMPCSRQYSSLVSMGKRQNPAVVCCKRQSWAFLMVGLENFENLPRNWPFLKSIKDYLLESKIWPFFQNNTFHLMKINLWWCHDRTVQCNLTSRHFPFDSQPGQCE